MNPFLIAAQQQQGSPILSLLIFLIPMGALVYLMIIPQRKQRQRQQAFITSLKVGDEVVTTGGIFGRITFIEDNSVAHLEVDTDVVIRVAFSSLARSASEPEPVARGAARAGAGRSGAAAAPDDDAAEDATEADAPSDAGDEAPFVGKGLAKGRSQGSAAAADRKKSSS